MMDWFIIMYILMVSELLLVKWDFFVSNLVVIHFFVMIYFMMRLIMFLIVMRVVGVTVGVIESLMHSVLMEVNWLDVGLIIELMIENSTAIVMIVGIGVPVCDILIVVMRSVNACLPVAICLVMELVLSFRLVRGRFLTSSPEMAVFTLDLADLMLIWCLVLDILRRVMSEDNVVPVVIVHWCHWEPVLLMVVMGMHIFFIVMVSDGLWLLMALLVILVHDMVRLVCGLVVRGRMVVVDHFVLMLVMGSFVMYWLMMHIVVRRLDDVVIVLVVVLVLVMVIVMMDFGS